MIVEWVCIIHLYISMKLCLEFAIILGFLNSILCLGDWLQNNSVWYYCINRICRYNFTSTKWIHVYLEQLIARHTRIFHIVILSTQHISFSSYFCLYDICRGLLFTFERNRTCLISHRPHCGQNKIIKRIASEPDSRKNDGIT